MALKTKPPRPGKRNSNAKNFNIVRLIRVMAALDSGMRSQIAQIEIPERNMVSLSESNRFCEIPRENANPVFLGNALGEAMSILIKVTSTNAMVILIKLGSKCRWRFIPGK